MSVAITLAGIPVYSLYTDLSMSMICAQWFTSSFSSSKFPQNPPTDIWWMRTYACARILRTLPPKRMKVAAEAHIPSATVIIFTFELSMWSMALIPAWTSPPPLRMNTWTSGAYPGRSIAFLRSLSSSLRMCTISFRTVSTVTSS